MEERSHQVALMEQIYINAWETLIWLGDDKHNGLAFDTINRCLVLWDLIRSTGQ